jgi:hypothetical protein
MPPSIYKVFPSPVLLCIDDNQDVLECEKAFLETFGYTVLTAPSGRKGLELASVHSVDVVIVDYVMPEMNGQEFAIEMRRLKPQAPIIMLSPHSVRRPDNWSDLPNATPSIRSRTANDSYASCSYEAEGCALHPCNWAIMGNSWLER